MDEVTDLAAHPLLPVGQAIDVLVDPGVLHVSRFAPVTHRHAIATIPGFVWRDSRETREDDPEAGAAERGLSDRGRPRKYTKINSENIDYKDVTLLRRFLSDRGKTRSRRVTGLSRRHQSQLTLSVKRARELALLPYVGER